MNCLAIVLAFCCYQALADSNLTPVSSRPLRIACVGDSITYGFGLEDRSTQSYPAQLENRLGEDWVVGNFGKNGATVLKKGHAPYWKAPQFKAALKFKPDVVVISLGTNDSRPMNWNQHKDQYVADYADLIRMFQELKTKPIVLICRTPPHYDEQSNGKLSFSNRVIRDEVLPRVDAVAEKMGIGLIDLNTVLSNHADIFPDGVHPDAKGAALIAKTVAQSLTQEIQDRRSSQPDNTTNSPEASSDRAKPNFIIIVTDDQGYNDLGCFGGKHVSTPRIDRMAAEGAKLTSFYVAASICTPSRAALMTGSYPKRVDMATGSDFPVLLAGDRKGLNPDEITIAEVLKGAGYKTGMFGKWHLGDQPEFLPTRQGFDEFFGLPYSHDIHPYHTNQKKYNFPPLPLLDDEEVIEMDPDADYLTKRVTERAVAFIEKHKGEPFFMYVPHPIPHRPLHASPPFMKDTASEIMKKLAKEGEGVDYKTRDMLFKQAIAEIDWSVGQILDTLKEHGIDDNTVVLFTSDNGPRVGRAHPLRGKKGSTYEGGMRVSTVVRWPGKIAAGQDNAELMTAMDLLPTFAALADAMLPRDRVIDGKNVWPVLTGKARSPHEAFFYHRGKTLAAVRSGPWKLHLKSGKPAALYNLDDDIGEKANVLQDHPAVVKELLALIPPFEADLKANSRPAAFVKNPKPLSKSPAEE
ncbi:MAG: sulfatase-like hydrolase/transferase [Phycisphaeraceae bacterium]|nr:sulfatase-like hydrolase/transferase [Phycisphaeraceae bacterium]